jgi:hypothetical protein
MKMRVAMCIRAEIKQLEDKVKESNSSKNKVELTTKEVRRRTGRRISSMAVVA